MNYEHYLTRLQADLTRLTDELSAIAHHQPETDDWEAIPDRSELGEADENLEADLIEDWNERRSTVAALETEYRDIKRAIQKISDGSYGLCEIDGKPIEAERLEVKPTARTCKSHRDDEATLPL